MISNKHNHEIQDNKKEQPSPTFEETVKRLLELPPKKQSEIRNKKKGK